jgi:succinoglycan biosynthesis protein ExoO
MPAFSVVMPIHNKGPHVGRALASALGQRFADFELIAVDDASTDDSVARIEAFADPRIRILRRQRPNPGGYAARNLAISVARAPWIAFLDADDAWDPEFLAEIARARAGLQETVGCISTGFRVAGGRAMVAQHAIAPGADGRTPTVDFAMFLNLWRRHGGCPIWTSALAIRHDLLVAAGGFPEDRCRRGGDKDTWLRVMRRTSLHHIPRALAVYHRDAINMTTRTEPFHGRHCIEATIEGLLAETPDPALRRRLVGVLNCEIWTHYRQGLRRGSAGRVDTSGFVAAADPLRFALLRLGRLVPDWMRGKGFGLVQRLRRAMPGFDASSG